MSKKGRFYTTCLSHYQRCHFRMSIPAYLPTITHLFPAVPIADPTALCRIPGTYQFSQLPLKVATACNIPLGRSTDQLGRSRVEGFGYFTHYLYRGLELASFYSRNSRLTSPLIPRVSPERVTCFGGRRPATSQLSYCRHCALPFGIEHSRAGVCITRHISDT